MTDDRAFPFVSKAVLDLIGAEESILADRESGDILAEAYESVTSPEERDRVESVLKQLSTGVADSADHIDTAPEESIYPVLEAVTEELAANRVSLEFTHSFDATVDPLQAALYSAIETSDVEPLLDTLPETSVEPHLEEGMNHLREGTPSGATTTFRRALEESIEDDVGIASRVLLAWAAFLEGNDDRAKELVAECLQQNESNWMATYIALGVRDEQPERVRAGYFTPEVYLRVLADCPADWTVEVSMETGTESEPGLTTIGDTLGYVPVPRLAPETTFHLTFEGRLPRGPIISSYYLALGLIDTRLDSIETADVIFESGPETTETDERLRFRR